MSIGSSGIVKPEVSGAGRLSSAAGIRGHSIRCAVRLSMLSEPVSRAVLCQVRFGSTILSQTPSRSATVMLSNVTFDDSVPLMPLRRIWRFGADSCFSTKRISADRSCVS